LGTPDPAGQLPGGQGGGSGYAEEVEKIEKKSDLSLEGSRALIKAEIKKRYTSPA
jgi:hypothetical protein